MSLFPSRILDLLQFCESHAAAWATSQAAIGITAAQATAFTAATNNARNSYEAYLAAVAAARAAHLASQENIRALRRAGGDTVRTIRAFAENQAKPSIVYMAAQIPPPATPAPMAPPGTPTEFRASLNTNGTITLRWKCPLPTGSTSTVYNIRRRLSGAGDFVLLGAVGSRSFTDNSLPAGTPRAEYIVTAQRAEVFGEPSSPFTVMFGVGGEGAAVITAQFSGGGRLAA